MIKLNVRRMFWWRMIEDIMEDIMEDGGGYLEYY